MPNFSGGFGGDRAGLMNLQNVLGGIGQNATQQSQMDMMRQNLMFQQGMAKKSQADTEKHQAFVEHMMPYQVAAGMGGWQMTDEQRMKFYPEMVRLMMGGKHNPMGAAIGGGGMPVPAGGYGPGNPPAGNDITDIRGGTPQVIGNMAAGALGGMFTPGGLVAKGLGAGAASTGANFIFNKAFDMSHPEEVRQRGYDANYDPAYPTETPAFPSTPRSGAMSRAIKSTSSKNVVKRNNRAVGTPNMDNVGNRAATAQALPGPN